MIIEINMIKVKNKVRNQKNQMNHSNHGSDKKLSLGKKQFKHSFVFK